MIIKMPPVLARNTLLSLPFVKRISGLPRDEEQCKALTEAITAFRQMKAFASEAHTELHLVKPILKVLGFAFESKPKFFEEQVKNPDFALFRTESDRLRASPQWGTRSYYENVLGLLMVKRYGRNLGEGISGFYLEFENRIPLYQLLCLTKTSGVGWGVLTNGKSWILLKKPAAFEKTLIEVDLDSTISRDDQETLSFFCHVFSSVGLEKTLPALMDEERNRLITFLQKKRPVVCRSLPPGSTTAEVRKTTSSFYRQIFPTQGGSGPSSPGADEYRSDDPGTDGTAPVKGFDQSDILSYLFNRGLEGDMPDFERILHETIGEYPTNEKLLSVKILDMTPGFGNIATRLTETIAYMSFQLPYTERHSFVAEWENDLQLHKFILDHVLYGVEKHEFSLAALQNGMRFRFDCLAPNYLLGNPLLGVSINEVQSLADGKEQPGLFLRHPREVMTEFRDISRLYFSLCDRIKEDAVTKVELEYSLRLYRQRIKEIMDLVTASYFSASVENRRIKELLNNLDADEAVWDSVRGTAWFGAAKEIAVSNAFFHMEIEFPFLLNERFDLIVVQPTMEYLWEERLPVDEAAKAYIKRAMTFLREGGRIILIGGFDDEVVVNLKKSKRYMIEAKGGFITVGRRH